MSFWGGLSEAIESNEKQRNVEQAREDRKAELAKADERFNMQWKNTIAQQDRTNERTTLLDARDEKRYLTEQGRLDDRDEAGRAAAKAAVAQATLEWDQKMAEWDYSKSRDVVADLKVAREESAAALQQIFDNDLRLHGRDIADANLALNEKKFKETVFQSGVNAAQWELSHQFKVDESERIQGNIENQLDYDKERHSIGDVAAALALEVAAGIRLYGREEDAKDRDQWRENMDLKLEAFKNDLMQKGLTQDNWERAFTRQGEQQDLDQANVMFGRKLKLLELSDQLTKSFGGQGVSTNGSKAPASRDMGIAVINIKSELGGKQGIDALPPESRDFFDKVLGDPAAAFGVYAFIQAQRKAGNKLSITDLPKYVNLAGIVEAQGDPDAGERLRAEIMGSDPGISNIDALFDGMKEAIAYKPARLVWGILQTPKDAAGNSADLKLFNDALYTRASARWAGMDIKHPEFQMYKNAIADLKSPLPIIRTRGNARLFDIMGAGLVEEMGIEDNPALTQQFQESKARQEAARQEEQIRKQDQDRMSGVIDNAKDVKGTTIVNPTLSGDNEVPRMAVSRPDERPGMGTPLPITAPNRDVGAVEAMPDQEEYTEAEARSFLIKNPDFVGKMYVDGRLVSNEPDASAEVPAEVQEAVKSVISAGDISEIEEAKQEIAAEFGEDVAGILFDNVKSARGTGKSAVMDGLQTPTRSSPEVAKEGGYIPPSVGATELNTPAMRNLPEETSGAKEGGYIPPSVGATELNTPAIREAIARVPAEVTEAIDSVVAVGDEAEIKEAKQEIAAEFGEDVAESLFWSALKKRPGNRTQDFPGFGN